MRNLAYPFATSLLFAGSFIAAKYTTIDLKPLTTTLLRYIVALVFLSLLLSHYGRSSLKVKKEHLGALILLGVFGIVGYHYFFFLSLRFTRVANTAIINALSPLVTGLMAAVFIRERLPAKSYWGVVLAIVGVILLLINGSMENLINLKLNLGDLLMLLSVISWVIYALLIKKLVGKYSGFTLTYYATLFGVLLLVCLAMTENYIEQIQNISSASIYSVLYMGMAASGLGYLLYNLSIKEIGPTRTSSFVYSLVPIWVAGLAFLFFNQKITPVMILSTALIVFGLQFMLTKANGNKQLK